MRPARSEQRVGERQQSRRDVGELGRPASGRSELVTTDDADRRLWEELGSTVHQLAAFYVFA